MVTSSTHSPPKAHKREPIKKRALFSLSCNLKWWDLPIK